MTTAAPATAIITSPNAELTAAVLKKNLEETSKKRKLMDQFIKESLKHGVDFDKPFEKADKKTLLKPGSEKVCVLLNLMPTFRKDEETMVHLAEEVRGSNVAFLCELVNRSTGTKVAEGRGSAALTEPNIKGNLNSAIKMAEKRAQMDATLRVAALSDRFTQDLDDPIYKEQLSDNFKDVPPPTKRIAVTPAQGKLLFDLWEELVKIGEVTKEKSDVTRRMTLRKLYGVRSSNDLTKAQASDFIDRIKERIKKVKAKKKTTTAKKTVRKKASSKS